MVRGPLFPRGPWKDPEVQGGSALRREGHVVTGQEGLNLWPSPLFTRQGAGDAEPRSSRQGAGWGVDC